MPFDIFEAHSVDIHQGPASSFSTPCILGFERLFSAETGSTYQTNIEGALHKTQTTDLFYGGIASNGLPIAMILDGDSPGTKIADLKEIALRIRQFVENEIVAVIENNALSDNQIYKLLKEKYHQLDSYVSQEPLPTSDAVFSLVLLFKTREGELRALCFGSGDTLVLHDNGQTVNTVLAAKTINYDEFSTPLSIPCMYDEPFDLNQTINHLEMQILTVSPTDRFLLLTDGAYEHLNKVKKIISCGNYENNVVTLTQHVLAKGAILPGTEIQELMELNRQQVAQDFKQTSEKKQITRGSDATIGVLIVPTPLQQEFLKEYDLNLAVNERKEECPVKTAWQWPIQKNQNNNHHNWQLHIHIKSHHIQIAIKVLQHILAELGFNYKYLQIEGDVEKALSSAYTGRHDEEYNKMLCIYLPDRTSNAIHPKLKEKIFKKFLLTCWKLLDQNSIAYSFIAPRGSKMLKVDGKLPTPFSYVAARVEPLNEDGHDAKLLEIYNPNNYLDPLQKIHLTLTDLRNAEITYSPVNIAKSSYQELSQCHKKALQHLLADLDSIANCPSSINRAENLSDDIISYFTADFSRRIPQIAEYMTKDSSKMQEIYRRLEYLDYQQQEINKVNAFLLEAEKWHREKKDHQNINIRTKATLAQANATLSKIFSPISAQQGKAVRMKAQGANLDIANNIFYQLHMRFVQAQYFAGNKNQQLQEFANIITVLRLAASGSLVDELGLLKENLIPQPKIIQNKEYFLLRNKLFECFKEDELQQGLEEYQRWINANPEEIEQGSGVNVKFHNRQHQNLLQLLNNCKTTKEMEMKKEVDTDRDLFCS